MKWLQCMYCLFYQYVESQCEISILRCFICLKFNNQQILIRLCWRKRDDGHKCHNNSYVNSSSNTFCIAIGPVLMLSIGDRGKNLKHTRSSTFDQDLLVFSTFLASSIFNFDKC